MNQIQRSSLVLAIIGAVNWGLIGFLKFDLVATIFGGQQSLLSRIIYSIVGLSGLYALTIFFTNFFTNKEEKDQKDKIETGMPNYGTEISNELDT